MKYRALARMLYDEPWVILPRDLTLAADMLRRRRRGGAPLARVTPSYGNAAAGVAAPNGVAVINLTGMITAKSSWFTEWFGGTALEKWLPAFQSLVDDQSIETIVINADSPGGHVVGTPEAAAVVFAARSKKRLIAVGNNTMCSGCYWICSGCHEIVGGPSSVVGSIGAIQITAEYSEYYKEMGIKPSVFLSKVSPRKGDGNEYEKLSPAASESIQARINQAGDSFVAAVAKHRGISTSEVAKNYGQGSWLYGSAAKPAGLVDRLATLTEVLIELGVSPKGGAGAKVATVLSPKPSREEANAMDKIIAALVEKGILAAGATEAETTVALKAYFGATGQKVPEGEAAILSALAKPASKPTLVATDDEDEEDDDEEDDEEPTSGPPVKKPKATQPRFTQSQVQQIADEAVERRMAMVAEIRAAGEILVANGLDPKHIDTACKNKKTLKGARAYFAEMLAEGGKPVKPFGGITAGAASRDVLAAGITEVLEQRCALAIHRVVSNEDAEVAGKDKKQIVVTNRLSEAGAQLRHKRLIDLVEISLQSFGCRVDMSSPAEVMRSLFGYPQIMGGMAAAGSAGNYSGPSTFPNLLSNIMNKGLALRMEFAPTTFRRWAAQYQSVTDFKPRTIIGTGEYQELPRKNDSMPREQSKPVGEEPSWISVEEYGDVTPFTFRMLTDDDLGAFMKSLSDKNIAADRTLNRLCVELLSGNALAQDGNVLFDAALHKNLITGPGTLPTAANMEAADALLMAQKGIDGERTLSLQAAVLLHPNKHKHNVRKELFSTYGLVPATKAETNVFRDVVEPVWEPMLTDADANAWYWFAQPAAAPAIYYAYMMGFESPKITQNFDWNTNVVNFATDQIFGVAVNNWRPVVRNDGA